MIKIDASNIIPKGLGTYMLGLIPGAVFGLTAAFGDPMTARALIDWVRLVYPFQAYALLLLFGASCLIVGQTFFLLAWFVDWLNDFCYKTLRHLVLHKTLGSRWLYQALGKHQTIPPNWIFQQLWRICRWANEKKEPFAVRPILRCQVMIARQILKRKYGVTPSTGQHTSVEQEWQTWLAMLGKTPARIRAAFLTMRTILGCGLAELTTLCVVPTLRNRYFVTMTGVLLAAGWFQALSFARLRSEPMRASFMRLATLIEELADDGPKTPKKEKVASGIPGLAISADGDDGGEENE